MKALLKPAAFIAIGVLIAMAFSNQVAGFANPILAQAKLSLS